MFLIISFTSKMKIMFETRFIIIIITIIITIIILSARKVKPEAFADDMDQDQTAHNVQSARNCFFHQNSSPSDKHQAKKKKTNDFFHF